jgi:hypothetical protein
MSFNEGIPVHLDAGLIQFRDGFPSCHHTMNYPAIFQKLLNYCYVLGDDLPAWDLGALPQTGAQADGMNDSTPIRFEPKSAFGATP